MSQQIVFFILAAITLTSAIVVVTMRNLFHAALALMVSFVGVAGIYVLLEAPFLGMAQLLLRPALDDDRRAVGDTKIDTIRRAITQVRLSQYRATGIVLHPDDWEEIELTKTTEGA